MKKPVGLFAVFIFACVALFASFSWQTGAQRLALDAEPKVSQTLSEKVRQRILADQQSEACEPTDLSQVPIMRPAAGTIIYAYDFSTDHLVSFDASAPEVYLTDVALTGLAGESLYGIDFRPSDGVLYGFLSDGFPTPSRLVQINVLTGAVTRVHPTNTIPSLTDPFQGFDINSADDWVRNVGSVGANRRINANAGTLIANDTTLRYAAGDVNAGVTPNIVHTASSISTSGAATLYGVDSTANTLVRIGGVNGNPSPNGGELTTIGPLGVNPTSFGGMDIQPGATNALASLNINSTPTLVSIDLATGAATAIGIVGGGAAVVIDGIAIQTGPIIVPTPVPTPTGLPSPSPSPNPSPSPTATATPRTTPTPVPSVTPTPIPPNASIVRAVNVFTQPGQTVNVPFELQARGGERTVRFSFRFNPSVLTPSLVSLGPAGAGAALTTDLSNVSNGYIGISFDSPIPFAAGAHRFVIVTFVLQPAAPVGIYPFSYSATPIAFEIRDGNGGVLPWWFEQGSIVNGATAAGVAVSGRVMTPDGRGLRNATVSITGIDGSRRVATTSSFGYYRFEDVEAGGTYVVSVGSKRYSYTARVLNVQDTLTHIDFVGN